jgi:hypothetical protein
MSLFEMFGIDLICGLEFEEPCFPMTQVTHVQSNRFGRCCRFCTIPSGSRVGRMQLPLLGRSRETVVFKPIRHPACLHTDRVPIRPYLHNPAVGSHYGVTKRFLVRGRKAMRHLWPLRVEEAVQMISAFPSA